MCALCTAAARWAACCRVTRPTRTHTSPLTAVAMAEATDVKAARVIDRSIQRTTTEVDGSRSDEKTTRLIKRHSLES